MRGLMHRFREACRWWADAIWPDVRLPEQTDREALASDWQAVTDDAHRAFEEIRRQL